jgi:peroxiredoxin
LADFQGRILDFNEKGIKVVGASVDNLENAGKIVERRKLSFPVAYGLDAREFARLTGAFFDEAKGYLHATGFLLRPDGTIDDAVYGTGPIGRLVAADTLFMIDHRVKTASENK